MADLFIIHDCAQGLDTGDFCGTLHGGVVIPHIARLFSRHRRNRWIRGAHAALLTIHKAFENLNYNIHSNGELCVMAKLSRTGGITTLFDVGANLGEWSYLAMNRFPDAIIHAFEIVPQTFDRLRLRFAEEDNVVLNSIGLAENEGAIDVHFSAERHALATCVPGFSEQFHRYRPAALSVAVTSGDRYCAQRGIERIGFLKIDVEGFEPQVLRGFGDMLNAGRIDVIQFEYGYINIDTHFLLKDFYDYLSPFGMRIGKIYPDYVEFRPYKHAHEDFYGPNYLAVRSDRRDLIEIFGRP